MELLWNAYTEEEFNMLEGKVGTDSLDTIELTRDVLGITPKSYLLYNESYNRVGTEIYLGEEVPLVVVELMLGTSTLYILKNMLEDIIGSEVVCIDNLQFYEVYGGEYILSVEVYTENPGKKSICTFWLKKGSNGFTVTKGRLRGTSKSDDSYDLEDVVDVLSIGLCRMAKELNGILSGRGFNVKSVSVRLSSLSFKKGVGTLWKYSWELEEWSDRRRYYLGERVEKVTGSNSEIVRSLILI